LRSPSQTLSLKKPKVPAFSLPRPSKISCDTKLMADRLTRLQQARDLLSAQPVEAMTQQEINAEIKAYRQEQRFCGSFLTPTLHCQA